MSDGTDTGTVMVKDIVSGSSSTAFYQFTAVGNTLYFSVINDTGGWDMWITDGTTSGTVKV